MNTIRPSSPTPRRPGGHTRSPTSPPRSGAGSTSGRRSAQYQASVSSSGSSHSHGRWQSDLEEHELGMSPRSVLSGIEEDLDPLQQHYVNAYGTTELKTFHCERVRKMPLSGLDPSMLIGFFCRDESDWKDFRKKVDEASTLDTYPCSISLLTQGFLNTAGKETQDHPLGPRGATELAFRQ